MVGGSISVGAIEIGEESPADDLEPLGGAELDRQGERTLERLTRGWAVTQANVLLRQIVEMEALFETEATAPSDVDGVACRCSRALIVARKEEAEKSGLVAERFEDRIVARASADGFGAPHVLERAWKFAHAPHGDRRAGEPHERLGGVVECAADQARARKKIVRPPEFSGPACDFGLHHF